MKTLLLTTISSLSLISFSAQAQIESHTLFDNLLPEDVGIGIGCPLLGPPAGPPDPEMGYNFCTYDADLWTSMEYWVYYGPEAGKFLMYDLGYGQDIPWFKFHSYDYTGGCLTDDTDLGNGWCRKTFSNPAWVYVPGNDYIPGTYIDASYRQLDNVVIDLITDNIEIDYDPWFPENEIEPKNTNFSYIITILIKSTSIAAGDAYDFDASTVDPDSLKVGPDSATRIATLPGDFDGDGDFDYVFGFRMIETGIGCLDDAIMIAGMTLSGEPFAGHDTINPINCEEAVDIDVDPFNTENRIRPNDNYNMTIALLGMRTADGDPINLYPEFETVFNGVNRSTLRVGPAETPTVGTPIVTDIDGDSRNDLLVNFNVYDAGIACDDTELELIGEMVSTLPIEGVDSIVTEDCSTGCHP